MPFFIQHLSFKITYI